MSESAVIKAIPATDFEQLHVLVLGRADRVNELTRRLDEDARVEQVEAFQQAMEALRSQVFDVMIQQAAGTFPPVQDSASADEEDSTLQNVGPGICIVSKTGQLEWADSRMLRFAEEVQHRACRCGVDTYQWAQAALEREVESLRGRRFRITVAPQEQYDIAVIPVIDVNQQVTHVAAVVYDVMGDRRVQDRIDVIDRAGQEFLSLEITQFARLDTQQRLALLEDRIRRCTHDLLHFESFEIFVLDRNRNRLVQVLVSGMPIERAGAELAVSREGAGICGYVGATARSYICPDTAKEPKYLPGIDNARSSLTVPLLLHEELVGVANFESARPAAFSEDDRRFAEVFGRYIALALQILELLVTEGQTVTGRVGSNVMAEITGPVNDIVTEVENLIEDYIGHDDLRHRLRLISENAVRIRETVKELTARKKGVIGRHSAPRQRTDPVLKGKRVLVVDDEEIILETVCDVLTGCGCKVTSAEDGAEAVALLDRESFDLVLSDIKLPGKNGYEVFASAKKANASVPVILMTGFGYDPNHAIVRAHREGLSAVLFKPFKVDQLLGELRTALQSKTKS
ncbi:MAG: response regulator [Planctomycetes bacterium]|nr:response regulator [Planctomycetota bacterium]